MHNPKLFYYKKKVSIFFKEIFSFVNVWTNKLWPINSIIYPAKVWFTP